MSRRILSKDNPYYLPPTIQRTVIAYARTYGHWAERSKEAINPLRSPASNGIPQGNRRSDPTADAAIKAETYRNHMERVEQAALMADGDHTDYLLQAVINGYSYYTMEQIYGFAPMSWQNFYNARKRFNYYLARLLDLL